MNTNWVFKNVVKFIGGIFLAIVGIIILLADRSKGIIFPNSQGYEAYLKGFLLFLLGIVMAASPYYDKTVRNMKWREYFFWIILALLCEVVPYLIFNL
jgi:drug/metabolite transporter (DMT)-like permease